MPGCQCYGTQREQESGSKSSAELELGQRLHNTNALPAHAACIGKRALDGLMSCIRAFCEGFMS